LDWSKDGRIALGKGQHPAVEIPGCERPQHLAGANPAGGQSEDNKIGWSRVERCAELAGLEALIDGETKLAQGLS
jgi:hypothetical protein